MPEKIPVGVKNIKKEDLTIPLQIIGVGDQSTSSTKISWNWSCHKEFFCKYRYNIDRFPVSNPVGEYGFESYAEIIGGEGDYYIHVQGKDSFGRESQVVHAKAFFSNIIPSIQGLSNDFLTNKKKTWNWSCKYADCDFRYAINSSVSHIFSFELFGPSKSATISSGTGQFFIHVQARNKANGMLGEVTSVTTILDNTPPLIIGLENDLQLRSEKLWSWNCLNEECFFRYSIDNFAFSFPQGSYTTEKFINASGLTGKYYLHIQAKDFAGNESVVNHYSVDMDAGVPEVIGLGNDFLPLKSKTWNILCNQISCQYRILINKSPSHIFSVSDSFSSLNSIIQPEGDGTYFLHIQAKNVLNQKIGPKQTFSAVLDNRPPTISGIEENDFFPVLSKTWNWICASGEACTYRFLIDGISTNTNLNALSFQSNTSVTFSGDQGAKYLHLQAKDFAGNISDVIHRSFVIAEALPEVKDILSDLVKVKSKTFNWSCNQSDCSYRFVANNLSSYQFNESAPFLNDTTFTKSDGTGDFYFHIQPKNNLNGIKGIVKSFKFILDNTAPIINIDGNDPVVRLSKTWIWSCNEPECLTRYHISQNPTHTFSENEELFSIFSATKDSESGTYYIHLQLSDLLGNFSSVVTRSFVLNNTIPTVLGLENDPEPTNFKVFNWNCGPATCVFRYVINQDPFFSFTNQVFSGTKSASKISGNGTFYIHVQAKDITNQLLSLINTTSFIMNAELPIVTGISNQGAPVKSQTFNWGCGMPDNPSGTQCLFRFQFNDNPNFEFNTESFNSGTTSSLSALTGNFYLHVQAKNIGTSVIGLKKTVSFILDNVAPIVTGLVSDVSPVSSKTWDWGCDDPNGCTFKFLVDTNPASTPSGSFGSTITFTQDTGNATYYIHVIAMDIAGNLSVVAHSSATLDNLTPQVEGLQSDAIKRNEKNFNWGCSAQNCTYRFEVNLNPTHIFDVDDPFISENSFSHNSGDGTHYFHIQAKNSSTEILGEVQSFSFQMDTTPPSIIGLDNGTETLPFKTWYLDCDDSPCSFSFIVDDLPETVPLTSFELTSEHTISGETGRKYLHIIPSDSAGNIGELAHFYIDLDSNPPIIFGISDEIVSLKSKSWSWECSTPGDCEFRHVINQNPTHEFTNEVFDQVKSDSISSGDGSFYLHVEAKKTSTGVRGPVKSVLVTLDNTDPIVTGIEDIEGAVGSHTWNWGCNDASSCTFRFSVDQLTESDPPGSYGFDNSSNQSFEQGTYYIHVQALDSAGNVSEVVHGSVFFDNRIPIAILISGDDPVPTSNKSLSWNCNTIPGPCEFQIAINASNIHNFSNEVWTSDISVDHSSGNGNLFVHVRARNPVNNIPGPKTSHFFTMDTIPPSLTGGDLIDDNVIKLSKSWSWDCDETPNCEFRYSVDENSFTDESTSWSEWDSAFIGTSISGETGRFYLHVMARDLALAETSVTSVFVDLDNSAPTITGISDDLNPSKTKTWNWGCDINSGPDAINCEFRYSIDQNPIIDGSTIWVDQGGSEWGLANNASKLNGDGDWYIHVEARKPVNGLSSSVSGRKILDNTNPIAIPSSLALNSPSAGDVSLDNTPQISGDISGEDGGVIEIFNSPLCDDAIIGQGVISSGSFSVTDIVYNLNGTEDGVKSFYAKITDQALNASICHNLSLSYTFETTPNILQLSRNSEISAGGGSIIIDGTSFSPTGNVVTIGGQACSIENENESQITCIIPANPDGPSIISEKDLVVVNGLSNQDSLLSGFIYLGTNPSYLSFWVDLNDPSTLFKQDDCSSDSAVLEGDQVGCILDKSGGGNHINQGDPNFRPLLNLSLINDNNVMSLDGDDDFLERVGANDFLTPSDEYTYFAVIKFDATQSADLGSIFNTRGGVGDDGVSLYANMDQSRLDFRTQTGLDSNEISRTPLSGIAQVVMEAVKINDERVTGIDGNENIETTLTESLSGNNEARVGLDQAPNFFKGKIGEILFYSKKLTPTERSIIANYLKGKWGIP